MSSWPRCSVTPDRRFRPAARLASRKAWREERTGLERHVVGQDGLTTDGELRETIEELWAFARDPYTVLGGPRVFQAWARR